YLIVDVRDEDFIGGNIIGAVNILAHEFNRTPSEFAPLLSLPRRLIFHCALSQVRGPKSANTYVREVLPQNIENPGQQVFVLTGGFSAWQLRYGKDARLTEKYDEELWRNMDY
ncbi:Rhodanese-like domain-containing protein, partial [Chytriomyces sp. MP71]